MRGLELNRCLKMYRDEVLDKLDPKQVLSELPDQAILCCYEDDPRYCHRSEVAKWFKRELGLKVEEIILWPDDISIT
jgi:uncharacterized protein (DUF488 family)